MTRSCIGCRHWEFDEGFGGSDVTPSDGWSAQCNKKNPDTGSLRWTLQGSVNGSDWHRTMQAAETCLDYTPRPGAPR